jgi:hypothetical protein
MRFWSTAASLEVIVRKESAGDLLRLDAATPALVLAPEFTEMHASRVMTGLAMWLKKREQQRAGIKETLL